MTVQAMDIKVASNSRMILPLAVCQAMGLHGEAKVILTMENNQVRLSPIGHGASRAKALYRQHARHDRTTEDFLNDRAAEAARGGCAVGRGQNRRKERDRGGA